MINRQLLALLGVLVVATCSGHAGEFPDSWTGDDEKENRTAHAALEGKPMLPLDLTNWINGAVSPADMTGKVVVLDLFSTTCAPCIAAIPHNNDLLKKYKDKGLVFVGICTGDYGQDKITQIAKDRGVHYPIGRDPELKAEKAWAVAYYPTLVAVDRKGIVRVVGLDPDRLDEVVRKLLDEPAPATVTSVKK